MKRKRWGKKYADKRNWKKENEKYVMRGEFYINPMFLDNWIEETKNMNLRKVGQPYFYPDSMIEFCGMFYAKGFDYRECEGILRGISKQLHNFPVIHFSQIRRRMKKLPLSFKAKKKNLKAGSDGTGMKVSNRGEWIREKWDERRGWIKVVIMGDTEGNIVDIRIGNEDLDENASGRGMLRKNKKNIDEYIGDGLYDAQDNFALCKKLGIKPVIKIRKNASVNSNGCMDRKKQVLEYKELGYKKWANKKGYGMRWPATEGIISATKRMFGESLRSHKTKNMYHEARLKFWAYQKVKDLA